jgi:hypothetical protein
VTTIPKPTPPTTSPADSVKLTEKNTYRPRPLTHSIGDALREAGMVVPR